LRKLLIGFVVVLSLPLSAAPARAYWSDSISLEGHGWGHGRGMGQYGALGYAQNSGWSYTQILDRYYGGTVMGSVGNDNISVHITRKDNTGVIVLNAAEFGGPPAVYVERSADNTFAVRTGPGCAGPWSEPATATAPVGLNPKPGQLLTLCEPNGMTAYRGAFQVIDNGGSKLLNLVATEDYVKGVVPREMGSSFHPQALRAQAVAARSYARAFDRDAPYANQCDTTKCQVYGGQGAETANTNAAADATAGEVRRFASNNAVASTEFSSSTGGWTAGGTFPAVADDGDAIGTNPNHAWNATVAVSKIESAWAIGKLSSITVTKRNGLGDWGGRATEVRIQGSSATVTVSGSAFRDKLGLKSDWFRLAGNWEPLGGSLTSAPAVTAWGPGRLDVFARGDDGSLIHKWFSGSWSNWESLGGVLTADPAAVSWAANRIDVFVRGTDNGLYHKWWDGSRWNGWEPLGGVLASGPAVASWSAGRLDVFVKGTDDALWRRSWNGSRWTAWESLGGVLTAAPAAVSWASNRIDVFVKGTDNALWHKWWDGARWSGWEPQGGSLASAPAAASWAPARLDIFAAGTEGGVIHKWFNGAWSGWESLGAPTTPAGAGATSAPAAASWAPNRIDLFVQAPDNALWHRWYDGVTWSG
jgi:SpoIID/LytB domain protein